LEKSTLLYNDCQASLKKLETEFTSYSDNSQINQIVEDLGKKILEEEERSNSIFNI